MLIRVLRLTALLLAATTAIHVPPPSINRRPRQIRNCSYSRSLSFSSVLSPVQQDINREIYEAAYSYISKTCFPNIDAGAMYLVAATSQENRGSGDPNIFSGVRMTEEVYTKYPSALASFSCSNTYGLETYSGYNLGPLSLSPDFLGDSVAPEECGKLAAPPAGRFDVLGVLGDRMNWYDSCNMASHKLDVLWRAYYSNSFNRRGLDVTNKYAVVAITSMAMHQGASVLTEDDGFMPTGQAECGTPQFWFDWCNIISQPKYTDTIRLYVNKYRPRCYENSLSINSDLIIPIMEAAYQDACSMRSDFFSTSRYNSCFNWIHGNKTYRGYVGSEGEKTSAALKVLVSYIIMEERYSGKW